MVKQISKEVREKMQESKRLQQSIKICDISSKYELWVDKRQFMIISKTNQLDNTYYPSIYNLINSLLHGKIRANSRKAKCLEDLVPAIKKSEEQVKETAALIQSHLDKMQKEQGEEQLRMNSLVKCHTE